jgi:hypothetical protein
MKWLPDDPGLDGDQTLIGLGAGLFSGYYVYWILREVVWGSPWAIFSIGMVPAAFLLMGLAYCLPWSRARRVARLAYPACLLCFGATCLLFLVLLALSFAGLATSPLDQIQGVYQ